jgi:hypothetical protein
MKKLISFTLSVLIILNTFGFNLIVILMIQESRTENLEIIEAHPEAISAKNIITFSLKYDKPEFINSREISYKKEMYDVVYKKELKDDTILYCISDKNETKLRTAFRSLNELNDNPASVPDHIALTILKNLLKNYLPGQENKPTGNFNSLLFSMPGILSVPSVIPEKICPPPQLQIISC